MNLKMVEADYSAINEVIQRRISDIIKNNKYMDKKELVNKVEELLNLRDELYKNENYQEILKKI